MFYLFLVDGFYPILQFIFQFLSGAIFQSRIELDTDTIQPLPIRSVFVDINNIISVFYYK